MNDNELLTREYVRESGKFYFRMAKEHMKVVESNLKQDNKKITALVATSTVIGAAGLIFAVLAYLK
jgi:hypothetical protein